jgi:hypothetical protein
MAFQVTAIGHNRTQSFFPSPSQKRDSPNTIFDRRAYINGQVVRATWKTSTKPITIMISNP